MKWISILFTILAFVGCGSSGPTQKTALPSMEEDQTYKDGLKTAKESKRKQEIAQRQENSLDSSSEYPEISTDEGGEPVYQSITNERKVEGNDPVPTPKWAQEKDYKVLDKIKKGYVTNPDVYFDEETGLKLTRTFDVGDELLKSGVLSTNVALESVNFLRNAKDNETFLICNKELRRFQIVTRDHIIAKSWNLPDGVNFHQPVAKKVIRYNKSFDIDEETKRKVFKRQWIEYKDFRLPTKDQVFAGAFLLVTSKKRICLVDIDKLSGRPTVTFFN